MHRSNLDASLTPQSKAALPDTAPTVRHHPRQHPKLDNTTARQHRQPLQAYTHPHRLTAPTALDTDPTPPSPTALDTNPTPSDTTRHHPKTRQPPLNRGHGLEGLAVGALALGEVRGRRGRRAASAASWSSGPSPAPRLMPRACGTTSRASSSSRHDALGTPCSRLVPFGETLLVSISPGPKKSWAKRVKTPAEPG